MKLWLLRPFDINPADGDLASAWDGVLGFVVLSPSESSARHSNPWQDPKQTLCEELTALCETGRCFVWCAHGHKFQVINPGESEITADDVARYFNAQTAPGLTWLVSLNGAITWKCASWHDQGKGDPAPNVTKGK